MSKYSQVNNQGTSILGVLLALGVFAIMSSAIVSLTMGSFQGIIRSDQWITANSLALEGYEGARSVRDRAWNELKYNQSAISTSTMGWALTGEGTSEQSDIYSRTINFSDVCRASSSEIVVCPNGYKDVHSKKIDVNVSWPIAGIGGATTSAKYSSYLTNWEGHDWISTNWTGGAGQAIWADSTKYSTDDNNIYHADTGEIKLYKDYQGGGWFPSGGLEVTDTKETDFNQGTYSGT
ncbi:MAG: hypothetical protein NT091_01850, partial [Candidatus Falkowbacteria bacterium]|nr:hypothetical protein [Candidatus Falkowbacteria bacterium]